jgi:hypothetical protein
VAGNEKPFAEAATIGSRVARQASRATITGSRVVRAERAQLLRFVG